MLWVLLIPVCVLWAFIEPVLLALGQERRLSSDVQSVLRVLIIGAPGYIAFESLKKYLQCQGKRFRGISADLSAHSIPIGIMRLSTFALVIVSPINLALNVAFVHHTPLRLLGSPLALSITYWIAFFLLALMTVVSPTHRHNETWGGFQIREALALKSVWIFLKLALPGILMVGTEWSVWVAYEIGRLLIMNEGRRSRLWLWQPDAWALCLSQHSRLS